MAAKVEAKKRKHHVQSAQFDGPTPLWAQQMQAQMQQMEQRIGRRIQQESQRSRNFSRHTNASRIFELIRLDNAQTPQDANLWFPANQEELWHANSNQVNALLQFYDLDGSGSLPVKRARLEDFLGVVL